MPVVNTDNNNIIPDVPLSTSSIHPVVLLVRYMIADDRHSLEYGNIDMLRKLLLHGEENKEEEEEEDGHNVNNTDTPLLRLQLPPGGSDDDDDGGGMAIKREHIIAALAIISSSSYYYHDGTHSRSTSHVKRKRSRDDDDGWGQQQQQHRDTDLHDSRVDDNNNKIKKQKLRRRTPTEVAEVAEVAASPDTDLHRDGDNDQVDDDDIIIIDKDWLLDMGRRSMSIASARRLCDDIGIDHQSMMMIEKSELISAIVDAVWEMDTKHLYWLYNKKNIMVPPSGVPSSSSSWSKCGEGRVRRELLRGIVEGKHYKNKGPVEGSSQVSSSSSSSLPLLTLSSSSSSSSSSSLSSKLMHLAKTNPFKLFALRDSTTNNMNGGRQRGEHDVDDDDDDDDDDDEATVENLSKSFMRLLPFVEDEKVKGAIREAKRHVETEIKLRYRRSTKGDDRGCGEGIGESSQQKSSFFGDDNNDNKSRLAGSPPPPPAASASSYGGSSGIDWDCDFGRIIHQAINNPQCSFKTLGLDSKLTNTITDVKKRWAKLILTLHPDKVPLNWKRGGGSSSSSSSRSDDDDDTKHNSIMLLLGEAVQKVNDAKKKCEAELKVGELRRPYQPLIRGYDDDKRQEGNDHDHHNHHGSYKIAKSKTGRRTIEIHWMSSSSSATDDASQRRKVEKYHIFLQRPDKNDKYPVGTVQDSSDPWVVISEDDVRFTNFFAYDKIIVYITAYNAAGHSEPLTIEVPLSGGIKFPNYFVTIKTHQQRQAAAGGGGREQQSYANYNYTNGQPSSFNNNNSYHLNDVVSSLYLVRNDITLLRSRLGRLRVEDLKALIRFNLREVPRGNKPLLIETLTDAVINNRLTTQ